MAAHLEHLNPATLLVDVNIRADLGLDQAFLQSIDELGVLTPVVAVRSGDGIRVRAGHRRTVAAVEVGLDTIPVLIVDDDGDQERIIEQIAENTQRAALAPADLIGAVEQLALLGVPAERIARRTALASEHVATALAAASKPAVLDAVTTTPGLTLEHAGWLAELDQDEDQRDWLAENFTGDPGRDRHLVEQARAAATLARAMADAAQQLTAAGHTRHHGSVYEDPAAEYLTNLTDQARHPLTPENHQSCPGHAYTLHDYRAGSSPFPIETPAGTVYARWLCTDWRSHGHLDRYASSPSTPTVDDIAARTEQRRTVIALNRAGDAALKVRRGWLTDFTRRRTPAKDHAGFMWEGAARRHLAAIQDEELGLGKVEQILGLPGRHTGQAFDTWITRQPQTLLGHLSVCARLWSYELRLDKSVWRAGDQAAFYLTALEGWGYTLSDVEQVTVGRITEAQAAERVGAGT